MSQCHSDAAAVNNAVTVSRNIAKNVFLPRIVDHGMEKDDLAPNPTILFSSLVQWTWGLPQNLLGFIIFLICIRKKHGRFRTSIVTFWDRPDSLSCGMFVFLTTQKPVGYTEAMDVKNKRDILLHEYGHTLQSLILGPLFLPVIGIPSFIWAALPVFDRLRERKGLSYYWFYCEKWATKLGEKVFAKQPKVNSQKPIANSQ